MLKTLRLLALTASFGAVVAIGCSGDDKDSGANLPPRNSGKDGGETNTSSSGGTSGSDSGGTGYDCSNHAPVSDTPACDQCSRSKCCEWITKCDGSDTCKAAMKCISECAEGDIACILLCGNGGTGASFLEELGACATNNCKNDCKAPEVDAGVDAF